jgi:hypothetical protein
MRKLHVLAFLFGTLIAPRLGAAQPAPNGLLTSVEVRQLVSRGEPADHARLVRHFALLEARYAADAKRHEDMARRFAGQPRGQNSATLEGHCRTLAKDNGEMATVARELASYHEKAAAGAPAAPPADPKGLQSGKGAPDPNAQELDAFLQKATAANDHTALADYFDTLRKQYETDAGTHKAMAAALLGTRLAPAAAHCDRLIALAGSAAKEARDASAMHRALVGKQ